MEEFCTIWSPVWQAWQSERVVASRGSPQSLVWVSGGILVGIFKCLTKWQFEKMTS